MLSPNRPEFNVGDLVGVVVHGLDVFGRPVRIRNICEHDDGSLWAFVEGSEAAVPLASLTLATEQTSPPPADPWDSGVRASEVPIAEGSNGCPFDDDLAKDFAADDNIAEEFETAVDAPLCPNKADIAAHLYALFAPAFVKDFPEAWIEIAYGHAATGGAVDQAEPFSVFDLKEAADFAAEKNKGGFNIYVSPAIRQGEKPKSGRAKDTAVVTSVYAWSEFDKPGDGERIDFILKEKNLRRAIIIVTGRTPHLRAHLYFKLTGSVTPDELRIANAALKVLLGSDDVASPAHLMRLAGTVNHPTPKKRERGYVPELVTLHNRADAPAYTVEHLIGLAGNEARPSSGAFGFDTKAGRTDDEIVELLERSRVKGEWHNAIRNAIASMIGRGWNDLQIKLACSPYCKGGTDDPDLGTLIEGARKKWDRPGNEAGADDFDFGANATWDDPDWSLLDDRRGTLPEFPADVLFGKWKEWLARASHGAGVTHGHVAVPLLATIASLIGTARRIRASRSWSEPFTLWTAIVGFSGSGKTPGISVTKSALSCIEKARKNQIAELQRRHDTRSQTAKAAAKAWKEKVEEAIEASQPPPQMPVEAVDPGPFVTPRLHVSDATIERHAVLLQARPRGMLLMADELASLFLNMGRYSNGSDKEFWLEAWNGLPYVVERMGRPAVAVDHLLIGMTGGFQPDKLARSFEGDSDGMHARVLFAWPEEPAFHSLTDDVTEIEPELLNALGRIVDLPAGEEDGVFAPRDAPLSADARSRFEQFRQFQHCGKDALDGREREWWAKGPSQVLRLAGTLCYLDWAMEGGPEPQAVEARFIEAAVRLWRDYLWPHSRAAVRQIGLTDRHAETRRALRWIRAGRPALVSREDVRRDALSQRFDADEVQTVLDGLVRAGWLREVTTKAEGRGRPTRRWEVNPKLLS